MEPNLPLPGLTPLSFVFASIFPLSWPRGPRGWKSEDTIAWLRKRGLHSLPNSIKAEIGDIVYNGPKNNAPDDSTAFAPPPGRFVYFTGSRTSNDPPPMSRRQSRE